MYLANLIKEDTIVPFDDDKELDDYTAKDWEELNSSKFRTEELMM